LKTISQFFVQDYPGELTPEETFTHSHLSYHQSFFISFLDLKRSIASSLLMNDEISNICTGNHYVKKFLYIVTTASNRQIKYAPAKMEAASRTNCYLPCETRKPTIFNKSLYNTITG